MPTFEIRDERIDEAEINRRIEESLKQRQSESPPAQAQLSSSTREEGHAGFVQDIELRDSLGFLRKQARELPDYKVFGIYKTLRRFGKKQIALDKSLVYFLQILTNRLGFLSDRLERLQKEGDASARQEAASERSTDRPIVSQTHTPASKDRIEKRAASGGEFDELTEYFHFRFNGIYGGSDEEIRGKGLAYIEYFKDKDTVLDVGCGRGVFLDLLRENGIHAIGIDSNKYMVEVCLKKALDVECADALEYLAKQANGQFKGIFASHVIEHFSGDDLVRFAKLCYDKLAVGGCAIFETPNPLSAFVLGGGFHLDITHVRPVHPEALNLLLDTVGFKNIQVIPVWPFPESEKFQLLEGKDKLMQSLNRSLEKLNSMFYTHYNYAIITMK
ncbi:MAG: class I SAM-dependent methyltransferase [Candidatus Lindowbacteria bacterium]|nr:class I SAM-dependent methyltransferase [Candidatus Lindowbacteria bacterium]